MKSIFRNTQFIFFLLAILLITAILVIRPDLNSFLSGSEKIDELSIGSEIAKEVSALLDDLPKESFNFFDSVLYFKTLPDEDKRLFIGKNEYAYDNVASTSGNIKTFGTNDNSGASIYANLINKYEIDNTNLDSEQIEINDFFEDINANLIDTRKSAIISKSNNRAEDIFLSVLYNTLVDSRFTHLLTAISAGKLKYYPHTQLDISMISKKGLKDYQSSIRNDTIKHRALYKLVTLEDKVIGFRDLDVSENAIELEFKPLFLHYNFRDEKLYCTDIDPIKFGYTRDNGFTLNGKDNAAIEFLRKGFGLPERLLDKKVSTISDDEKNKIRSCIYNIQDNFQNFGSNTNKTVYAALIEYIRMYIYSQEKNPYAFLIFNKKLYTLNDFLFSELQGNLIPYIFDWDALNGKVNEIFRKKRAVVSAQSSGSEGLLASLNDIIFIVFGCLNILLIGYLLYYIYRRLKFQANFDKLKLIQKQISGYVKASNNEQERNSEKEVQETPEEYALSQLDRFIDFVLTCKSLKPSIFSTLFSNKKVKLRQTEENKFKIKKGFLRYKIPVDNMVDYKVFDSYIDPKNGSLALELTKDNYVLINKYGELYKDKSSRFVFPEIYFKNEKKRWFIKEDKNDPKEIEVDWSGERKIEQYYNSLSAACDKLKINKVKGITINDHTKKRNIIFNYADQLEELYFEIIPKLKIESIDELTLNSMVNDVVESIENPDREIFKIESDLAEKVDAIKDKIQNFNKLLQVGRNDEFSNLRKQQSITKILNSVFSEMGLKRINNETIDFLQSPKYRFNGGIQDKIKNILAFIEKQDKVLTNNKFNWKDEFDTVLSENKDFSDFVEFIINNFSDKKASKNKKKAEVLNNFRNELNSLKKDLESNAGNFENFKKIIEFLLKETNEEKIKNLYAKYNFLDKAEKELNTYFHQIKDTRKLNYRQKTGFEEKFHNLKLAVNTLNNISEKLYFQDGKYKKIDLKGLESHLSESLISNIVLSHLLRQDSPKPVKESNSTIKTKFELISKYIDRSQMSEIEEKIGGYYKNYIKIYEYWETTKVLKDEFGDIDIKESLTTINQLRAKYEGGGKKLADLLSHHKTLMKYISTLKMKYVSKFYDKLDTKKDFKKYDSFKEFVKDGDNGKLMSFLMEFMLHSYYFIQNATIPDTESENNYQLLKNNFRISKDIKDLKKRFRAGWMGDSTTLSNQIYYLSKLMTIEELKIIINNYIIMPWDEDSRKINKRD